MTTRYESWGSRGDKDGQFIFPHSVALDMNGNIYISDSANDRIQCFNSEGKFIHKWGREGKSDGEFISPTGLAISVDNGINQLIAKEMCNVHELSSFPSLSLNSLESKNNTCIRPGLLSICLSYIGVEYIYVADSENNRIQVFELNSSCAPSGPHGFICKWGEFGYDDGQFDRPSGFCVVNRHSSCRSADGPSDCCVVARPSSSRFADGPSSCRSADGPSSCRTDNLNNELSMIYVTDTNNDRIQVFSKDNKNNIKFVCKYDYSGNNQDLYQPSMASIGESELIYICDTENHRIICYDINKSKVIDLTDQLSLLFGLKCYTLMNLLSDGNILYVSVMCHVYKFAVDDLDNIVLLEKWGSEDDYTKFTTLPNGMAKRSDANGSSVLYVVDTYENKIVAVKGVNV